MSSAHTDGVARRISADAATFASLPLALAQRVFLALPVDARGRACCVCRAWRDALADPSLWSRLDMSPFVEVEEERFVAVLHGAAGRAQGQLCVLDLSQEHVSMDDLLPVLTANAGSLRELHLLPVDGDDVDVCPTVEAVVAAAPLLQVVTADEVGCTWKDAPRMLRAEPPFAPLQIRHRLHVSFTGAEYDDGMENFGPFAAALADVTLQPALSELRVHLADTEQAAVMGALVDAVLARRLRGLTLDECTPPAAVPLARLLAGGSLATLEVSTSGAPLLRAAGAALVADALRMNTTLTILHLCGTNLCGDMNAAGVLLGALVGHPSLRELRIIQDFPVDIGAFGAALGALIAADAPALQVLDCSELALGDAGLAPIVKALALNRHLRTLNIGFNFMSKTFACERLLPAVRANTTLRELKCVDVEWRCQAEVEAVALVRHRGQYD